MALKGIPEDRPVPSAEQAIDAMGETVNVTHVHEVFFHYPEAGNENAADDSTMRIVALAVLFCVVLYIYYRREELLNG